ncbi:hypothetical protein O1611_g971 [Lasiodiplodia mahajangana]|uniref:Uncharacterized protein n=1 Tax=Lasiodiplodia mahajangana TaxID=1108764 RepID=A0ACC2JZC1_9PEZI|nr:hypothetical protein O1611_g971 [Lasiodiplodia mahajangana]
MNRPLPEVMCTNGIRPSTVRLDDFNMTVITEAQEWPRSLQRASLNSFGYARANAHAILESASSYLGSIQTSSVPASQQSLKTRVQQVQKLVQAREPDNLDTLAYTLTECRSHFTNRQALVAQIREDGKVKFVESDIMAPNISYSSQKEFAFVFTGQGAQYPNMGKSTAYPKPGWTLEQTIIEDSDPSQIHSVARSQPICTAVQIALVDLLGTWGVHPASVVGHSSGEIAAAYAARLIDAKSAILVAYFRGYALAQLKRKGAMLAAGLSAPDASKIIQDMPPDKEVCIACVNAPESVTLSGPLEEFRKSQSFYKRRAGSLYEELISQYLDNCSLHDEPDSIKMFSSVDFMEDEPDIYEGLGLGSAGYWRANLERPVQFNSAVKRLISDKENIHLIEIGPHPALKGPVKQIATLMKCPRLPYSFTLSRDRDADISMKILAGTIFVYGHNLSWQGVHPGQRPKSKLLQNLPPYPWDYSQGLQWQEPRISTEVRNRLHPRHELLGSQQVVGNGINWQWRNTLHLDEVSWLRGHKLESQIVFPAAAYLSVVMEALRRAQPSASTSAAFFEFHNVSFGAALVIQDEGADGKHQVELHTTLSPKKLSATTTSGVWHEFSISSWKAGQATMHSTGTVRFVVQGNSTEPGETIIMEDADDLEEVTDMNPWYRKFEDEGLCFGLHFKSVTGLKARSGLHQCEAICTTRSIPALSDDSKWDRYTFHPATIDACLQSGIMSSTGGDVNALNAYLPVFLRECWIRTTGFGQPVYDVLPIHARSTRTGISTQRFDSTLRDSNGSPVIVLRGVRMSQYISKGGQEPSNSRQPCLRVSWKPDIQNLNSSSEKSLGEYLASYIEGIQDLDLRDDRHAALMTGLIDLAAHKNPQMRVVDLGQDASNLTEKWLSLLNKDTGFQRYGLWTKGRLNDDNAIILDDSSEETFDVVIIPHLSISTDHCRRAPRRLCKIVKPSGIVITHKTEGAVSAFDRAHFSVLEFEEILLAINHSGQALGGISNREAVIIVRSPSPSVNTLANAMRIYLQREAVVATQIVPLDKVGQIQLHKETLRISLLEAENEFLASMDQQDMDLFRIITNSVTNLLWVTGADMLGSKPDADLALCNGFSRALVLEQPSLRFSVIDIGSVEAVGSKTAWVCENIIKALAPSSDIDDKEFIQKNGLLHVSRFIPDYNANSLFCRRLCAPKKAQRQRLRLKEALPSLLSVAKVGVSESIYFQQTNEPPTDPPEGFVDVLVKAVGLNAKDVYAINGRIETPLATTANEVTGLVIATGLDVHNFEKGDRVVIIAPTQFATTVRVPASAAHKMLPNEVFTAMTAPLVAYTTAIYALWERACLRVGESVLIHSGAGAFGIAAISLAMRMGAVVYTTAGSEAKRTWLAQNLGVPRINIFDSRSSSFAAGIQKATEGRGVDVVVNSLVGDLLHASWACIAPFGRFVEIGKKELIEGGSLEMEAFERSATFTAFDLSSLFFHRDRFHRDLLTRLTREALDLYRSGHVKPVPTTEFDVSRISEAYRYFSSRDRVGKVVISLQDDNAHVPVMPPKYASLFDQQKVYLLVGCLGGLGRSLARWMLARGARTFVFLGRSGCDKATAQDLVHRLKTSGASVTVVRGDVSKVNDVAASIAACVATHMPIGGVVQAAMGLQEGLFSSMTTHAWHKAIQPKWAGSRNLYTELKGHDASLDFYLLMSSVSGSVGTATESNYCAANSFLDAFARRLRCDGIPAVSVGLGMVSEVGYLHENPTVETLLLRKGIQPLSEAEFLQVIDLAISESKIQPSSSSENSSTAHILTGLEASGARRLMEQGFDVSYGSMQDPRTAVLRKALAKDGSAQAEKKSTAEGRLSTAIWSKFIPTYARECFASVAHTPTVQLAILKLLSERLSSLVLMPIDQIEVEKPLIKFGMDSMIASELRTWLWISFKVDVPFFDLISPDKTLVALSRYVEERLLALPPATE